MFQQHEDSTKPTLLRLRGRIDARAELDRPHGVSSSQSRKKLTQERGKPAYSLETMKRGLFLCWLAFPLREKHPPSAFLPPQLSSRELAYIRTGRRPNIQSG